MTLDADLAFAGPEAALVDEARPLVTRASDLDPETLASLVRAAYFCPSDAPDADAWATQAARADDRARRLAWSVLASEDEARRRAIAHAVSSELAWLLPTRPAGRHHRRARPRRGRHRSGPRLTHRPEREPGRRRG